MTKIKRLNATIHGKVQGVSFRFYTQQSAHQIGLVGWVRNKPDRTVEVSAEGTEEQLQKLVEFLHEGSPMAQVEKVDVTWQEATGEFTEFRITH